MTSRGELPCFFAVCLCLPPYSIRPWEIFTKDSPIGLWKCPTESEIVITHLWTVNCSGKLISAGAVTSQWKFKNNCELITWMYTFFYFPPCEVCFLTFWTKLVSIDIVAFICMRHFAAQTSSNYFTFALIINLVRQFNCYVYSDGVYFKREWKVFRFLTKCYVASHIWDLSADFTVLNINDLLCSLLFSIFRQRWWFICW